MQGLIETGGSHAPAESRKSGYKRYIPTLAAFMAPAIGAGMFAAFAYADAKSQAVPEIDLATRVEIIRYAAQKVPTIARDGSSLVRVESAHPPIEDVTLAATTDSTIAQQ